MANLQRQTGLRNINSKSLTEDDGKLLENIIFLELFRRENKIYYFKQIMETDFILVDGHKAVQAIQVTDSDLEDEKTFKREVYGLVECLQFIGLNEGLILTRNRKEILKIEKLRIKMIPCREWLLS